MCLETLMPCYQLSGLNSQVVYGIWLKRAYFYAPAARNRALSVAHVHPSIFPSVRLSVRLSIHLSVPLVIETMAQNSLC
jgi:hypothetical protein